MEPVPKAVNCPELKSLLSDFEEKGYLQFVSEDGVSYFYDNLRPDFLADLEESRKVIIRTFNKDKSLLETRDTGKICGLYEDCDCFLILSQQRFLHEFFSLQSLIKELISVGANLDEQYEYFRGKIVRSIEFPPEYLQSGLSILNYFGTVVRQKYPHKAVKLRIEQDELKVTMLIETAEGEKETIEEFLEEYGLVVLGRRPLEGFLPDDRQILELSNKLELAKTELKLQQNLLMFEKAKSEKVETRLDSMEVKQQEMERQIAKRDKLLSQLFLAEQDEKALQSVNEVKNLTVMFLDLKGFSRMSGPEKNQKVETLRALGSTLLAHARGMYINTWGDAVVAGFENPDDALSCGCKFIEHLAIENIEARIGMSQGNALVKYNTMTCRLDIEGESIDVGARLEQIAEPGEVLISKDLYNHAALEKLDFVFTAEKRKLTKGVGDKFEGTFIECYAVKLSQEQTCKLSVR